MLSIGGKGSKEVPHVLDVFTFPISQTARYINITGLNKFEKAQQSNE